MTKPSIRVSLVEDDVELRRILKKQLSIVEGIVILKEYDSIDDALRDLSKNPPDVVITEIHCNSPITVLECMFRVKQKYPDIKFLIYTVLENNNFLFEALKYGANGYILKSDNIPEITQAIREVYEGGVPMSRSIAQMVLKSFSISQRSQEVLEVLTCRQIEIIEQLLLGKPYKEIASDLRPPITEDGLRVQISRIYKLLEVSNRTEAINKYLNR